MVVLPTTWTPTACAPSLLLLPTLVLLSARASPFLTTQRSSTVTPLPLTMLLRLLPTINSSDLVTLATRPIGSTTPTTETRVPLALASACWAAATPSRILTATTIAPHQGIQPWTSSNAARNRTDPTAGLIALTPLATVLLTMRPRTRRLSSSWPSSRPRNAQTHQSPPRTKGTAGWPSTPTLLTVPRVTAAPSVLLAITSITSVHLSHPLRLTTAPNV